MWRKPSEAAKPSLAGQAVYGKQVPLNRAVALWGGVSPGGFAAVVFHKCKKLTSAEWANAVRLGKLRDAIVSLHPTKPAGPWHVLCDNERFLTSPAATAAHRKSKVTLWKIPRQSPDLNPVELFWGWLRRRLRTLDLKDLVAKKPLLGKMAYKARVARVCQSQRAQRVAAACAKNLRTVCLKVIRNNGAASGH